MRSIPAIIGDTPVSERTLRIVAYFRRTIVSAKYHRHIDDIIGHALLAAVESIERGESVEWACKAARRAFWPTIEFERRSLPLTGGEAVKPCRKPPQPVPAWYFAKCSPTQETVLRCRFEADLGEGDTAKATGRSVASVKTHYRRGLANVKKVVA
jgi:hypothetical protein